MCPCAKYLKKVQTDFNEVFGKVEQGSRKNRLDFGGDPDRYPDSGIFKGFSITPPSERSLLHEFLRMPDLGLV